MRCAATCVGGGGARFFDTLRAATDGGAQGAHGLDVNPE